MAQRGVVGVDEVGTHDFVHHAGQDREGCTGVIRARWRSGMPTCLVEVVLGPKSTPTRQLVAPERQPVTPILVRMVGERRRPLRSPSFRAASIGVGPSTRNYLEVLVNNAFFPEITAPIAYEGPHSDNPLAFRWYDADRVVLGKTMRDHLRFAVCYWHSFAWDGFDIFGAGTLDRPWHPNARPLMDPMDGAKLKMAVAFEFFEKLGAPFYCFHDRDIAPEGASFAESAKHLDEMVELAAGYQKSSGVELLWGTANLFSNARYQGGAATNPDPEVFAYAAGQVAHCMEATKRLDGKNYVLWGGREGYETLLNTDLRREVDQLARFLTMVVEHKHAIGFTGALLLEPKPFEPTKHQYDYDVATVDAFLQKHGLASEIKVNIEVNHATLSGHDFAHEIAVAVNAGILGSIDANAGDDRLGWDLDRFPVSVEQMTLGMLEILKGGGLTTGGLNFDAKLRRQSTDRVDLFHGHIGGMDTMARALLVAASIVESGALSGVVDERYSGWTTSELGRSIMGNALSLRDLHARALTAAEPRHRSGRQEVLENLVARFVERSGS